MEDCNETDPYSRDVIFCGVIFSRKRRGHCFLRYFNSYLSNISISPGIVKSLISLPLARECIICAVGKY